MQRQYLIERQRLVPSPGDGVIQAAPALLILAWDFHVSLFLST